MDVNCTAAGETCSRRHGAAGAEGWVVFEGRCKGLRGYHRCQQRLA